jgi:nitrate/TMAO reductase-like tetraheme cytochrome c subunit
MFNGTYSLLYLCTSCFSYIYMISGCENTGLRLQRMDKYCCKMQDRIFNKIEISNHWQNFTGTHTILVTHKATVTELSAQVVL